MLKVVYKDIHGLTPYENNARTHSEEQISQIAASITEFGFNNPILLDKNNEIIAGHGRLLAAQLLNMDKVPCVKLEHLSDAQKRAYVIADNKLALNAGWNIELLSFELDELTDAGFDVSLTGFSEFEIEELLEPEELSDPSIPDELPDELYVKTGDIWRLGRHILVCGDSTKQETYSFIKQGVDLYLTDPPYNVAYVGKTKDKLTIQNDDMDKGGYEQFLGDAFANADNAMKKGAAFYIFHADSNGLETRLSAMKSGFDVRQVIVWVKNSMVMGRQDYQWQHEPCLYGWKNGASHSWYSDRSQTTILRFDRPSKSKLHPTMKPVALFDYLIKNSTKQGDVVLDNFCGSGTTIIACEQNDRVAIGIEKDPAYAQVIIERWEELTGKKAVKNES